MVLYDGRPATAEGREPKEMRVYDLLDSLGIAYQRTDHAPATTMEVCEVIDAALGCLICKNLFLCNRQQTEFYLLMMPGDKVFKTKELSHQIGSARLSFAKEEQMMEFLEIHPGAVSIMGLMNDTENHVQLLVFIQDISCRDQKFAVLDPPDHIRVIQKIHLLHYLLQAFFSGNQFHAFDLMLLQEPANFYTHFRHHLCSPGTAVTSTVFLPVSR